MMNMKHLYDLMQLSLHISYAKTSPILKFSVPILDLSECALLPSNLAGVGQWLMFSFIMTGLLEFWWI